MAGAARSEPRCAARGPGANGSGSNGNAGSVFVSQAILAMLKRCNFFQVKCVSGEHSEEQRRQEEPNEEAAPHRRASVVEVGTEEAAL